jgi:hypothetical protein
MGALPAVGAMKTPISECAINHTIVVDADPMRQFGKELCRCGRLRIFVTATFDELDTPFDPHKHFHKIPIVMKEKEARKRKIE